VYDIVKAQFIIEQSRKSSKEISVDELAEACGFDHRPFKEQDGYQFFSNAAINFEHSLKELDLEKPLILLPNGKLIDGHHRLYRAFMLGIETLQAYTLSPAEAKLC
jgi:hypothetical protein